MKFNKTISQSKNMLMFRAFSIIALFVINFSSLYATGDGVYEVEKSTVVTRLTPFEKSEFNVDTIDISTWKPINSIPLYNLVSSKTIYISFELPVRDFNYPCLAIQGFSGRAEIFYGDKVIYSNIEGKANIKYRYIKAIPLENYKNHKRVIIRLGYTSPFFVGYINKILIGEVDQVTEQLFNENNIKTNHDLMTNSIGAILFTLGVLCLLLSFWIRKYFKGDYSFIKLSALLICAAFNHIAALLLGNIFNLSPYWTSMAELFTAYLLPVAIFVFLEEIFYAGKNNIIRILVTVQLVSAFISIVLLHFASTAYYVIFYNNWIFLADVILSFLIVVLSKKFSGRRRRIIVYGFSATMLIFSIDVLVDLLVFAPRISYYGLGILVLVGTFSYILITNYIETYRKMNAYEKEASEHKSEVLKLQRENIRSQLEALKNQINPHFLFNSFSSLIALIEENSDQAIVFVERLSIVYRYVLQTKDTNLTELSNELDFIEAYLFLLKIRFDKNLIVKYRINKELNSYYLPPLCLQLLVENAVKHNIVSSKKPLTIEIFTTGNDFITVRNNLQEKNVMAKPTRIGLNNIIDRYKMLSDKEVIINKTEEYFSVQLPLIKDCE